MATYLLNDDDGSKVEEIEKSKRFVVADCRTAMLTEYFKNCEVSWETVLNALTKANYINLAEEIKLAEKL